MTLASIDDLEFFRKTQAKLPPAVLFRQSIQQKGPADYSTKNIMDVQLSLPWLSKTSTKSWFGPGLGLVIRYSNMSVPVRFANRTGGGFAFRYAVS
jgi:hypothetical protein